MYKYTIKVVSVPLRKLGDIRGLIMKIEENQRT